MRLTVLCLLTVLSVFTSVSGYYFYDIINTGDLEEGDNCIKLNGEKGTCIHYSNCPSAIAEVRANGRPEICSFVGIFPVVCCKEDDEKPLSNYVVKRAAGNQEASNQTTISQRTNRQTTNTQTANNETENKQRKSIRKCLEYYPLSEETSCPPNCSSVTEATAKPGVFPFMALLGVGDPKAVKWICSGSLISEQFVLTAAHCLFSKDGEVKHVRLGELDLSSTTDDADPQDFTIKNTYSYPYYASSSKYHDIALLELDRPARFTRHVYPICLGVTSKLSIYRALVGVGWDLLESEDKSSTTLQTANLFPVNHWTCAYNKSGDLANGIVDAWQICTDTKGNRTDTCHRDSVGPLVLQHYSFGHYFPEIVGVMSFGNFCTPMSSVHTRLNLYVSWIEVVVWPDL